MGGVWWIFQEKEPIQNSSSCQLYDPRLHFSHNANKRKVVGTHKEAGKKIFH
jgi:hypothetical protein